MYLMSFCKHLCLRGLNGGMDSATQVVNALAQVYRTTAHHKKVTVIQVKHDFFEANIRTWSNTKNTDDFGW